MDRVDRIVRLAALALRAPRAGFTHTRDAMRDGVARLCATVRGSDGEILGTLSVVDDAPRSWTDDEVATLDDVARSLATEVELDRARAQLDDYLEQTAVLVHLAALDGRILFVNRAWRTTLGYDHTSICAHDIVAPDQRGVFMEAVQRVVAGQEVPPFDTVFETRRGVRLVMRGVLRARFENGSPVSVRATFEDVTAKLQVDEAQTRLVEVLEATSDFVGIADMSGNAVYINRAGRALIGLGPDEVLTGLGVRSIYTREGLHELVRTAIPSAIRGSTWQGESSIRTRAGRVIPVSQVIVAHESASGGWYFSAIVRDISAQKEAEDALKASEERFRRLAMASNDGIVISRNEQFVEVNAAWSRMCGYPEGELPSFGVADCFVGADRDEVLRRVRGNIEGTYYAMLQRSDGTSFEAEITSKSCIWQGLPARMAVVRDVTEWRRLNRMKNEFVSTVSHELRTPLTSIRGALGLLEGGVGGAMAPKALDLLRMARENSDRLIRLINELLDLDKIEAGKLELKYETLTPSAVVRTTLDGIAAMADEHRIKLVEHVEAHRSFSADRDRIVQVLTNLVSNAIKFSPAGSAVEVEATAIASTLVFAVHNEGPGIPSADVARLFARFQQLDSGDNRRRGGTGLGLAISKAIVEQHGGRIGVRSEPNVRTTFWFEVPMSRAKRE